MNDKNNKISSSMAKTRQKRKGQVCRVYKVKIDESRLSAKQKEQLKMIFVEAKWITNEYIRWSEENNLFDYKPGKTVVKKDKDMNDVEVSLNYISVQMIQSVVVDMQTNIKSLSTLKKNGFHVGKLKYRKEVNSINLKQYGQTFKILNPKYVKIEKIKGTIPVNGLDQFIKDQVKKNFMSLA